MKEQIKELEQQARLLETTSRERNELLDKARQYGQDFLNELPEQPAYQSTESMGRGVYDLPIEDQPRSFEKILQVLKTEVDTPGLNSASGRHAGYIPGGSLYPSAIADYLASLTNRYTGIFFSSPGAVRIENLCIRWMCDLLGFPDTSGGNLTSGGSMANLIGLVAARDDSGLKAKEYDRAVVYLTHQVHHCVIKAVKFAGLQEAVIREIPMDKNYRMQSEQLRQQIQQDKEQGLLPLIVFASAGTTDLGAVDPLDEIADVAEQHQLWFHVDAAYGGFFLLTEEGRDTMKGIDRSDSVTIDPHKGLFLPYGSGAVLVKDVQKLYESQHMTANYLQDTLTATEEASPADLSPELSKHFRGLRMWLPLQLYGVEPFRASLKEKIYLTRYFYEEIQKVDGIEVGPPPQLSILFFRFNPPAGDANDINNRLVQEIHKDGRIFLSSTHLDGVTFIRLAVLHFRTHLEEIDLMISVIKEKIEMLKEEVLEASV